MTLPGRACLVCIEARRSRQPGPSSASPQSPGRRWSLKITKEAAGRKLPLAVPALSTPGVAAMQTKLVDPFTATLRSDLEYTGVFVIADPAHYPAAGLARSRRPPRSPTAGVEPAPEILVDTRADVVGDKVNVEARVWDLKAHQLDPGTPLLGRRSLRRAHRPHARQRPRQEYHRQERHLPLDDRLRLRPGQRRGRSKDIYAMDFDGRNVRRLTTHQSLAINPDARGGKVVLHELRPAVPQIWMMNADGNGAQEITTGLELNASPALSPDGPQIAFVGSAQGNSDIYRDLARPAATCAG